MVVVLVIIMITTFFFFVIGESNRGKFFFSSISDEIRQMLELYSIRANFLDGKSTRA